MKLYNEYYHEHNTYDSPSHNMQDDLLTNLQNHNTENLDSIAKEATENSYNSLQLAKTWRKGISHGLNWIPIFGGVKIGLESLAGTTLGGEKLSPTQRKLYGLGWALSAITYGLIWLSGYTSNPWLLAPSPICSMIASAATAAGQASIAGDTTSAGKIFKAKLKEQRKKIILHLTNMGLLTKQIDEVNKQIAILSDQDADAIVNELIQATKTRDDLKKNIHEYTQRQKINIHNLNKQLPENDDSGNPYIYRWMYNMDVSTLQNIVQHEWLQINKLEEGEDMCFTSGRAFNQIALHYATLWDQDLSIIIQLSRDKLLQNKIFSKGAADKVTIHQDIPSEILQTWSIFVINYAKQRLEKISVK